MKSIFFAGNFFLLDTYDANVLVLNLESRKKFWIQKAILRHLINEKLPDVDQEGEPYDRNNFWPSEIQFEDMSVEVNSIEIYLTIDSDRDIDGECIFGAVG